MEIDIINSLLTLGMIGVLGFFCQWLSVRVRLPAILFLLSVGILFGPVSGLLNPDALFGDMLFPFISFSVAVILFEGALTLRASELREIGTPVRNMVTFGVLISCAVMATAAHYIVGLSWQLALLFGAIMVVTGPTVIVPMLRTVRPVRRVADVLRWEGIVIDPIGALFAVLVFEWIVAQQTAVGVYGVLLVFLQTLTVGCCLGVAIGYLFGLLLRQNQIPENLHNFASLTVVCFAFAASESIAHESGLVSVTVMGVLLANMRGVNIHSILEFKEDLTLVFVSALFIVLAARIEFSGLATLGWSALGLLAVMQLLARPLKVVLSFIGSNFTWREQALIAWIGPRGIVAAAISAVFALRLQEINFPGAEQLVPLAFLIIIGTVVLQSLSARSLANLLGVARPRTDGVLLIGANKFSIAVAQALNKINVEALICDTRWDALRHARIVGLNTYYGNPSSEHATLHLNMSGYGAMLGLSNHREYNVLQAARFNNEFGARNVLILPSTQGSLNRSYKHATSEHYGGRSFLPSEYSYANIRQKMDAGAKVRVTEVSDEYGFSQWRSDNPRAQLLMVVEPDGNLVFIGNDDVDVEENSQLLALYEADLVSPTQ